MHSLWSLVGAGPLDKEFHLKLLADADPSIRAWGVRAAGNQHTVDPAIRDQIVQLGRDPSPDVRLQTAIAARKIDGVDAISVLLDALAKCADDPIIPAIVWQNFQPLIEDQADAIVKRLAASPLPSTPATAEFMSRLVQRVLERKNRDAGPVVSLLAMTIGGERPDASAARKCLALIAEKIESHELSGERLDALREQLKPVLAKALAGPANGPLYFDAALLAATWKDEAAMAAVRNTFLSAQASDAKRFQALGALLAAHDGAALDAVDKILADPQHNSTVLRASVIGALGRSEELRVATILLARYRDLEPDLQPKAIELLTQRPLWAKPLIDAIGRKEISADALNVNQVQRLLASRDPELIALVTAKWGAVRSERNPEREKVVGEVRDILRTNRGDARRGQVVFKRICAQCHRIYGEGQDVGPEITSNGRASFQQLLSNVLDPSLVIGAGYQARVVALNDGRTLTGLLAEDSRERIVLKEQGGKQETIARKDIDSIVVSKLSLMPEGMEKQMTRQELIDLFEFLMWDKNPSDPTAKRLPGSPR
jgi:putative heme-binding domain-containing protein